MKWYEVWSGMKYEAVWSMKYQYEVCGMKYEVWSMKWYDQVWSMKYVVSGMKYVVWSMKYEVWSGMKYEVLMQVETVVVWSM